MKKYLFLLLLLIPLTLVSFPVIPANASWYDVTLSQRFNSHTGIKYTYTTQVFKEEPRLADICPTIPAGIEIKWSSFRNPPTYVVNSWTGETRYQSYGSQCLMNATNIDTGETTQIPLIARHMQVPPPEPPEEEPPEEDLTDPDDWHQVGDGVDHGRADECFQSAKSLCTNGMKPTLWSAVLEGNAFYCSTYPNYNCSCQPGNPLCDFDMTTPWPGSPDGGDGGGDDDGGSDGGGSDDSGGGSDGGGDYDGGGSDDGGSDDGGSDSGGDDDGGSDGSGDGSGGGYGGSWGYTPVGGGSGDGVDLSRIEYLLTVVATHTEGGSDNSDVVNAINELAGLMPGVSTEQLESLVSESAQDNKYLLTETINRLDQANDELYSINVGVEGMDGNFKRIADALENDGYESGEGSGATDGLTGFYDRRYESLEKVFFDGFERIEETPLFDFMEQFKFSDVGGTSPTWDMCFDMGIVDLGCAELTVPEYIWTFIRIIMILSASFVARRMIIGG